MQLNLEELQKREVKLANGQVIEVAYIGPIKVEFEDRICFTGAMVMCELMNGFSFNTWGMKFLPGSVVDKVAIYQKYILACVP